MSTNLPQSAPSGAEPEDHNQEEQDALQRDILQGRQFTLADVIGREGGSFMKGESPVPKLLQVILEINRFISERLPDASGALQVVLHRWVEDDTARVSRYLDTPLLALVELLGAIANHPPTLYELVRQVDMKWGEMNDERPHFQRPNQPPNPDDEYTHESVRQQLLDLMEQAQSTLV